AKSTIEGTNKQKRKHHKTNKTLVQHTKQHSVSPNLTSVKEALLKVASTLGLKNSWFGIATCINDAIYFGYFATDG
ncbi:hypothetical protein D0T50_13655, partial [Bacteroides sp. 214]|uniref:hypothetical protein n=1 Tax=Bacteroides sp. 214 TaxID=2302935 RepID=UPI0013D12035